VSAVKKGKMCVFEKKAKIRERMRKKRAWKEEGLNGVTQKVEVEIAWLIPISTPFLFNCWKAVER
jgi:hypothetical protein